MTETRTQYRAICPDCFAQQAVRPNGCLVEHGYTRPQQWHANVNSCSGVGRPHFGTPEGRDRTASLVDRLRQQAVEHDVEAVNVADGDAPVWGYRREKNYTRVWVRFDQPTADARAAYVQHLTRQAENERLTADQFQDYVDRWTAVEPVPVTVEKKSGPLLHWSGGWWRGGKACAGSAMGAQKGYATQTVASVTCPKCLGIIASKRFAAKEAK